MVKVRRRQANRIILPNHTCCRVKNHLIAGKCKNIYLPTTFADLSPKPIYRFIAINSTNVLKKGITLKR